MPGFARYPMSIDQVQSAFTELKSSGTLPGRLQGKYPPKPYLKNFEIVGTFAADPGELSKTDGLWVLCERHDYLFATNCLQLLATSPERGRALCPFCHREHGEGRPFVTVGEVIERINSNDGIDWVIDIETLGDYYENDICPVQRMVPLICRRKLEDGSTCGCRVMHSWNNIRTALKNGMLPEHIRCRGNCRPPKGKLLCTPINEFKKTLREKQGPDWTLNDPSSYEKGTGRILFRHLPCNNRRFGYGSLAREQDAYLVCPICTMGPTLGNLPLPSYCIWVNKISGGKVSYIGSEERPGPTDLKLRCSCGAEFSTSELAFRKAKFHGCSDCAKVAAKSPKAWVLHEAQNLVAARGYRLIGDPGSYSKRAEMIRVTDSQPCPYSSVLELLKALPVRGDRLFGDFAQLDDTTGKRKRTPVNHKAFEIPSPESAHWAGLLATDGNLPQNKSTIQITLKAIDEKTLHGLMRFVGFQGQLSYRPMKTTEERGIYATLKFSSSSMRGDLERIYKIKPQKTKVIGAPLLTQKKDEIGYLLGLIEGDGSIHYAKGKCHTIRFRSASHSLAAWVAEKFQQLTGCKGAVNRDNSITTPFYTCTCSNQFAETLYEIIRITELGTMARKWNPR